MLYKNVYIEALAYELPPNIISSVDIEKRLEAIYKRYNLSYGRLELMTGIRERRFWNKGTTPSQASTYAGIKALKKSGIKKEAIGCLIHGAVCRDFMEPATASLVHNNLGLSKNSMMFDLSNACLGFINSMTMVANMIELGQIEAGLVVSGECAGPVVDGTVQILLNDKKLTRSKFKKAFASFTLGSGAVAAVLTNKRLNTSGHKLVGGVVKTASEHNHLCRGDVSSDVDGIVMWTGSEDLLHRGCELAKLTWDATKKELGWNNNSPSKTFTHQVGSAHRKLLYKTLDLDEKTDFPTVEYLGNVGSVSLPITIAIAENEGVLKKGNKIAMLGIGSGLSSMMLGVEW